MSEETQDPGQEREPRDRRETSGDRDAENGEEHDADPQEEHDAGGEPEREREAGSEEERETGVAERIAESGGAREVEVDDATVEEKHVITGGEFECELQTSREATAEFLHDLADQIAAGRTLTVGNDNWEIPFEYGEPIELEIEHEEAEDEEPRELEIEVEFAWASDGDGLGVE